MKRNLFGTMNRTPGQNLIIALTNDDETTGIPPYNYTKMYRVFKEAGLSEFEVDVLRKGFGFDMPRHKQNQIAQEYNMDEKVIKKTAHCAVDKLKESPFKMQLKKLAPTLKELYELAGKGLVRKKESQEARETTFRLEQAKKAAERLEEALLNLSKTNAQLEYENERLQKKLQAKDKDLNKARSTIVAQNEENMAQKAALSSAREKYRKAEAVIFGPDEDGASPSIENLKLTMETKKSLDRAGISDVGTLCKMSLHSLAKMGVGQNSIAEVRKELAKRGLDLRQ